MDGERVEDQNDFDQLFRTIWVEHGDVLSVQYSGTPAIRTELTLFGKQTVAGQLRDLVNRGIRHCKTNFTDGFKQVGANNYVCHYFEIFMNVLVD